MGLLNVSKTVEGSLTTNFVKLNSKLNEGNMNIKDGLNEFSSHSQKQLGLLEMMLTVSDETLSKALSDLASTLGVNLKAIPEFKPLLNNKFEGIIILLCFF